MPRRTSSRYFKRYRFSTDLGAFDECLPGARRQDPILAIPVVVAVAIPLWHISVDHFIAGMVAATAFSGVMLLGPPGTYSRTARELVYGLLGGIVGACLSPVAFDIAKGNLKLYRVVGLAFVVAGVVVGFSLATLLSRQLRR